MRSPCPPLLLRTSLLAGHHQPLSRPTAPDTAVVPGISAATPALLGPPARTALSFLSPILSSLGLPVPLPLPSRVPSHRPPACTRCRPPPSFRQEPPTPSDILLLSSCCPSDLGRLSRFHATPIASARLRLCRHVSVCRASYFWLSCVVPAALLPAFDSRHHPPPHRERRASGNLSPRPGQRSSGPANQQRPSTHNLGLPFRQPCRGVAEPASHTTPRGGR